MNYQAEQVLVKATIAKYPAPFGLRGYKGDSFRICPRDTYHDGRSLHVVIHRLEQGEWKSFIRTTEAKLATEFVAG